MLLWIENLYKKFMKQSKCTNGQSTSKWSKAMANKQASDAHTCSDFFLLKIKQYILYYF